MNIRPAKKEDVPAIVEIIANGKLGSKREDYRIPYQILKIKRLKISQKTLIKN